MKFCNGCKQFKPEEKFYYRSGGTRRRSRCIDCTNKSRKPLLPEKRLEYARRARLKNPKAASNSTKKWRAANKEWVREYDRKTYRTRWLSRYGITPAEYDVMFESQGGVCAICKNPPTEGRKGRLSVDHDHVTGRVRSLLCMRCNVGLGSLKDDPNFCHRAGYYLEYWNEFRESDLGSL